MVKNPNDILKGILFVFIVFVATGFVFAGNIVSENRNINQKELLKADENSILKIMEYVADWQIANHSKSKGHDLRWNNSVFYMGLMELSKISKDSVYRDWLLKMGWKYRWQPHSRMYMANDIAVSQFYLEMYRIEGDKRMLDPTYARTEWVINHPSISDFLYDPTSDTHTERWCWCDALFMAPPVYARMYNITGDAKFLEFMDKEYRLTYEYLYDKNEQLFFRDHRFFEKRGKGFLGAR